MKHLLAGLFFLVVAGFLGWLIGRDLVADLRHRSVQLDIVRDARVSEARCKSRLFVIDFCAVKATGASLPGGRAAFTYFMIGSSSETPIRVLRARGSGAPAGRHLTTNYGTENLTGRTVTFAVLMVVSLGIAAAGIIGAIRARTAPSRPAT